MTEPDGRVPPRNTASVRIYCSLDLGADTVGHTPTVLFCPWAATFRPRRVRRDVGIVAPSAKRRPASRPVGGGRAAWRTMAQVESPDTVDVGKARPPLPMIASKIAIPCQPLPVEAGASARCPLGGRVVSQECGI